MEVVNAIGRRKAAVARVFVSVKGMVKSPLINATSQFISHRLFCNM